MRPIWTWLALFVTAWVCLAPAAAQLPVDVPRLPVTDRLRDPLTDRLDQTLDELDAVRRDTLDQLLRRNRDVLERGPGRTVILRDQITSLVSDDEALGVLEAAGFVVLRTRPLGNLPLRLHVLRVPEGLSTVRALALARQLDPSGTHDFNHLYSRSGLTNVLTGQATRLPGAVRVGLIDTGVRADHPALGGARVEARTFHGGDPEPAVHGTAVASLLVGGPDDVLYAADIYGSGPTGGSLDALLEAMGWMSEAEVGVVNVSLVGPPNVLLERVTALLVERGHVIVAAVGNDGPSADPLFPAAYEGVIGVTGVDHRGRILPEACRGAHVDFAALGREVEAAALPEGRTGMRGTSFAAPQITRLAASQVDGPRADALDNVMMLLESRAEDAGRRGRDTVYGIGIINDFSIRTASSQP